MQAAPTTMNIGHDGAPLPGSIPGPQPVQHPKRAPRRRVLTSLWLQVFIYFGIWYDVFYYVLNILVFVYKGTQLPYPNRNFAMEFCFSWLWIFVEIPRLFLKSMANKTERGFPLFMSFLVGLPLIGMYVYFVKFQTYVLKIDQILNGAALAFLGVQYLFGVILWIRLLFTTRFNTQ